MKKITTIVLVILLLVCVFCISFYSLGINTSAEKDDVSFKSELTKLDETIMPKIDYPLIEIPFNDGGDWIVAIRSNFGMDYEMLLVSPTSVNLQLAKQQLLVTTYPVKSEETEPCGYLYVYKDGKIYKEIVFDDIFFEMNQFESQGLQRLFENMTLDEFNNMVEDRLPSGKLSKTEVNSHTDYPLIDVLFDDESQWTVILKEDIQSENKKFYVCKDSEVLEQNKHGLKLSAIPVGRGTTPDGILYIYKNDKLIKVVHYYDSYFESGVFKEHFKTAAPEELTDLMGDKLLSSF